MELEVLKTSGAKSGKKVKLDSAVFGVEPNDHAIYLDVKQIQANGRQGTHKSKERGEVAGSRRKLRKQKGSGAARVGDIKNPLFRGGGRIFGPRADRDYGFKLNKKLKVVARRSALTYKAIDKGITIVENFNLDAPKTAEFEKIMTNLKLDGRSLVVIPEANKNVYLSSRNLKKANVRLASDLNSYEILNCKNLVIFQGAVEKIVENLK
ncbi:MAG: large subunit ribosomal protein L4 [Glaciecola sp.]|jgi:large subunit ribosomal protein L4